jgi:hypothetical protein
LQVNSLNQKFKMKILKKYSSGQIWQIWVVWRWPAQFAQATWAGKCPTALTDLAHYQRPWRPNRYGLKLAARLESDQWLGAIFFPVPSPLGKKP